MDTQITIPHTSNRTAVSHQIRTYALELICLLYVILFLHTAVAKLNDFEIFQNQLSKSPFIEKMAVPVSWMVPIVEILLAIGLIFSRTRMISLYLSLFTMAMFTAYIWLMLNYSYDVPCSCGGVVESLDWVEHLWFNVAFVALAVTGIFLLAAKQRNSKKTS